MNNFIPWLEKDPIARYHAQTKLILYTCALAFLLRRDSSVIGLGALALVAHVIFFQPEVKMPEPEKPEPDYVTNRNTISKILSGPRESLQRKQFYPSDSEKKYGYSRGQFLWKR